MVSNSISYNHSVISSINQVHDIDLIQNTYFASMYFVRIPKLITSFFPNYIWNVGEHEIALTFDDGPNISSTKVLLDILEKEDCRASFFLLGNHAERHSDLVEEIKNKGHAIGHHSYSHLNGWKISSKKYLDDVEQAYQFIQTPLFRPPYGKITSKKWLQIKQLDFDMKCCMFNFMPGDFDINVNEQTLRKRMYQVKGGDIIVLHDNENCLVKYQSFLPQWIKDMKAKDLTFVALK